MPYLHSKKGFISPAMIGRSSELEHLLDRFARVQDRQGQCVLITGEAGIGKSRFIAEFIQRILPTNPTVLTGHCYAMDSLLPYAPLLEIVQNLLAESSPEHLAFVAPSAPELVKRFPQLAGFFSEQTRYAVEAAQSPDPEQDRRRIFDVFVSFFDRISQGKPLVLVFEDIHWCDEMALDFLLFLARRMARKAIFLILTYRNEDFGPGVEKLLTSMDREHLAEEITLGRLTPTEFMGFVSGIIGSQRPLRITWTDSLYELTEGNPFFTEEVLKTLAQRGTMSDQNEYPDFQDPRSLQLPRSILGVVQERIQLLSPLARNLLSMASVIGKQFSFRLIQFISDREEPDLLPLIRELVDAQLILKLPDEQFAFRHALTRDAVYNNMLALERKPYHLKIAAGMEQLYPGHLDAYTADLAYHFFQAGNWEKAFSYANQAGEHALTFYSPHAAVIQLTRAIEAAGYLSSPPPAAVFHRRGKAYEILGDFNQARKDFETTFDQAQRAGDRSLEWQVLLDLGLLWASRSYDRTGQYYQKAMLLAQGIEAPQMLAESFSRYGNWQLNIGKPREAIRYYEDALRLFEQIHDEHGQAQTLELLGMATGQLGDARALTIYDRAVALLQAQDNRYGLVMSLTLRGLLSVLLNKASQGPADLDRVFQDVEKALQLSQEMDWHSGKAFVLSTLSWITALTNRFDQSLRFAQDGLEIAQAIEHQQWTAAGHVILGMIYYGWFDFERAQNHLEQGRDLAQKIGSFIWTDQAVAMLTLVKLDKGKIEAARALIDSIPIPSPESYYEFMLWHAKARLALAENQPHEALRLMRDLPAGSSPFETQNSWPLIYFPMTKAEALFAAGELSAAEGILVQELELAEQQSHLPLIWRLSLLLGKVFQRQKRLEEAERAFSKARACIAETAQRISEDSLRSTFLGGANAILPPLPARTPRQAAKQAYAGLTEREREVAALVACGKSNVEIGETLGISERTIATHVGSILNKLNFNSRTQVAVWAREKGLRPPVEQKG